MNDLYFMNFAIDQLWDEKKVLQGIFSVRVPQSIHLVRLNEDYPLLLGEASDYVLGYQSPDKGWLEYLALFNIQTPQHLSVVENPYDQKKWFDEVALKLKPVQLNKMRLRCFGISANEEKLRAEHFASCEFEKLTASEFIFLNSKFRALEIAIQNSILMPESEIVSNQQIQSKSDYLLKAEFSSGGGGNFDFASQPKTRDFILRRIFEGPACKFISQKKYQRKADWSYFGSTDDELPLAVMKVHYDMHQLSFLHELAQLSIETRKKLNNTWSIVRDFLLSHSYQGPFGIDAFETAGGETFTLIDLNVRWTKTHFIFAIAQKFGISDQKWNCQRIRQNAKSIPFSEWWSKVTAGLKLNAKGFDNEGRFVIPIMVSGLTALAESGPLEVTYLCGQKQGSLQEWSDKVFQFMSSESLWQI